MLQMKCIVNEAVQPVPQPKSLQECEAEIDELSSKRSEREAHAEQSPVRVPTVPSDEEKYWYAQQNRSFFYTSAVFSYACLMLGMVRFALRDPVLYVFFGFTFLVGFYLGLSYIIGCFSPSFDVQRHQKIVMDCQPKVPPCIDIYLPNCGEQIDILENTFRHVKALDWENLQVYVLDDKGRQQVRALSDCYGFHYLARPNHGELKKAGNLRYAFPRTTGEFIVIFDADFAPRQDFLKELLPYFYADPMTAIVQSPQFFQIEPEQPWVQKGAAYVQESFYRLIQVNRNYWGASVCVGTNAIYRRAALEPFGGTAPIAHSEDLHTGFNVIEAGWRLQYVPINLAKGLCPDTMATYFIQQYRWCTGSTSLLFSKRFWTARLPVVVKLNFLSGMLYYVATALDTLLTPLPSLIMIWCFPRHVFWYNWLVVLPSFLFGLVCLPVWSRYRFGTYALKCRVIAYHAHFFALLDRMRHTTAPWVPTNTRTPAQQVPHYDQFLKMLLYWTLFCFIASVGGSYYHMKGPLDINYYPMLFLSACSTILNLHILLDSDKFG